MFCFVALRRHNTEREKLCSYECQVDIVVGNEQRRELVNFLQGIALYESYYYYYFIIINIIPT